jgi:predicted permease
VNDVVGPGFFQMIGMRVLAGREFDWRDDEKAPLVAIISESLARRLFPGRDAVGQRVNVNPGVNQKQMVIVGVVNSASLWRIQSREPAAIYIPLLQVGPTGSTLDIRAAGDPATVASAARKIVEGMGHEYPLYIQTLRERMDRATVDERMIAWLSAFFGGLAMLLAAIGLYGLMTYSVTRRTSEIGVRMALGAERGDVTGLVLREVFALVGVGILIGIPAALAASKWIAGMLFGLSPTDPATIAFATAVLLAVALFAGYIPARQAARTDPMAALRVD